MPCKKIYDRSSECIILQSKGRFQISASLYAELRSILSTLQKMQTFDTFAINIEGFTEEIKVMICGLKAEKDVSLFP